MNAPELLRAGGWRQVPSVGGSVDWQHTERHGTTRFELGAAMLDELERVSADRIREAHGFARREAALQMQVADLQRIEELAKRKPNYQTALEAWSAEIGQRQAAQAELDQALGLLREAAPALLEGAKELRKAVERAQPGAPEPSADLEDRDTFLSGHVAELKLRAESVEAQLAAANVRIGKLEDACELAQRAADKRGKARDVAESRLGAVREVFAQWGPGGRYDTSADACDAVLQALASDLARPEPHWLIKDFHVLYASARALADACNGRGDGRPYLPLRALEAQLERLKPAFAETEATRAEFAGRGSGA